MGRPGWNSRLLSAWLSLGCCRHLESDPVNGRFLSVHLFSYLSNKMKTMGPVLWHMGTGLCLGCSTSDLSPSRWLGNAAEDGPSPWALAFTWETGNKFLPLDMPSSGCSGSLGNEIRDVKSLSAFLSVNSAFQVNKYISKKVKSTFLKTMLMYLPNISKIFHDLFEIPSYIY